MLYDPPISVLLYGGPGVGKTATAVSSFWDWENKEKVADGRLITFGRENNPALGVPVEMRQVGKDKDVQSLRFASPSLDDMAWLDNFENIVDGLILNAEKGNCLDALVVDGMSELDLLFEAVYQKVHAGADKWDKWDALLDRMFGTMTRLDPEALNCCILVTARVMERKKAKQAVGGRSIAGDPNFVNFDYYPSLRGSFRLHFPHYFNLVLYMDTQQMRVTEGQWAGQTLPAHLLYMVRRGEFYVKNQWETDWIKSGEELEIVNPTFPNLHERLVAAANKGGKSEVPTPIGEVVDET